MLSRKSTSLNTSQEIIALSELFSNFELNGYKIRVKHTFGSGFLAEWMPRVNSSFGPVKFGEDYEKTDLLQPVSSSMLGGWDAIGTVLNK